MRCADGTSPSSATGAIVLVLKRQCLDRRIDDREELEREIAAWERQRNLAGAHLKWMFATEKARTKMGRAYPRPAATLDQPAKES